MVKTPNIDKKIVIIFTIMLGLALVPTAIQIPMVTAQAPTVTSKYVNEDIPLDPNHAMWKELQLSEALLAGQQLVYPFSLDKGTRTLKFVSVHNGTHLAIYIEWDDETMDVEEPGKLDVFGDAVAVQFPVYQTELPNICMGTVDNPVNIVFWKAGVGVQNLVAGTGYGLSPEQREALGLHKVPTSPIERLPDQAQIWDAKGVYDNNKWKVVLIRPLGSIHELVPTFRPGESVSIVFAQWDGSKGERAGAKATGGWMTLKLEAAAIEGEAVVETVTEVPAEGIPLSTLIPVIVIGLGAVIGLVIAIALIFGERKKGS